MRVRGVSKSSFRLCSQSHPQVLKHSCFRLAAERQNIDHASGSSVVETETFRRSFGLLEQHITDSWLQRISPFDLDWPSITDVPSESSSTTAVRAAAAHVVVVPAIAVCSAASTLQAIIRNRPRWAGVAPPVAVLKMK